jgi:N-acetyl-anhydromuramyl-L-alanine amidase AmpD
MVHLTEPPAAAAFAVRDDALIPVEDGQAVSVGWPESIGARPLGVTWHWTVTWDLALCRKMLGGRNPVRKGEASAHYAVGRSYAEGVDRYVALENRSWHAGRGQTLRWNGAPLGSPDYKASRSTIGVETVNIGYATSPAMDQEDWLDAASPLGRPLRVQPWTAEQLEMMIAVGREIQARWPALRPEDHHGHLDLCPAAKLDPAGLPLAEVLRGIYPGREIVDHWTPTATVAKRQRGLAALGYDLGPFGVDGQWGPRSLAALKAFQDQHGLVVNGAWTSFVSARLHEVLDARGLSLAEVTAA